MSKIERKIYNIDGKELDLTSLNQDLKNEKYCVADIVRNCGDGTIIASEENLRRISEATSISYGQLSLYAYKDEYGQPVRLCIQCTGNGAHYFQVRRQVAPPGMPRRDPPKKRKKGPTVQERLEIIDAALEKIGKQFPRMSWTQQRCDILRDGIDMKITPRNKNRGTEYAIVISTKEKLHVGKTHTTCDTLKRLEQVPGGVNTLVLGLYNKIPESEKILVTPFMSNMVNEGFPVFVADVDDGRIYEVEFDKSISVSVSRELPLLSFKEVTDFTNLKFEVPVIDDAQAGKPYDLKTKLVVKN